MKDSNGKNVNLIKGKKYDVETLVLVGWTTGDGTGAEGYHLADYFSAGVYIGADQHGIVPLVTRK